MFDWHDFAMVHYNAWAVLVIPSECLLNTRPLYTMDTMELRKQFLDFSEVSLIPASESVSIPVIPKLSSQDIKEMDIDALSSP